MANARHKGQVDPRVVGWRRRPKKQRSVAVQTPDGPSAGYAGRAGQGRYPAEHTSLTLPSTHPAELLGQAARRRRRVTSRAASAPSVLVETAKSE